MMIHELSTQNKKKNITSPLGAPVSPRQLHCPAFTSRGNNYSLVLK